MRWFKIAAIAVGILIAFLVVGSVIGFIFHILTQLVIAALVVGGVVIAVKVARSRREVSGKKAEREVRDGDYEQHSRPLPRPTSCPPRRRHIRSAVPQIPRTPQSPLPRTWRTNSPGSSGKWAAEPYQFASASLVTAAWMPSIRTRAAARRPITHRVSSAGLPTTVTAGVAFLAVIR